jgi:hypothetical protein
MDTRSVKLAGLEQNKLPVLLYALHGDQIRG